jgi:hypothetical protein
MAKHWFVILNLQILCGDGTSVRKMLDIWPAILIVVCNDAYSIVQDGESIIDALEHDDCVCEIDFNISSETLQTLLVVMDVPFPVLTTLRIQMDD